MVRPLGSEEPEHGKDGLKSARTPATEPDSVSPGQIRVGLGYPCADDACCARGVNALLGEQRVRQSDHGGLEWRLAYELARAILEQ